MQRSRDWFQQAIQDFKAAKSSLSTGHYEWASFQAHQAVEKSLKALIMAKNIEVWGHSLFQLYEKWLEIDNQEIIDKAMLMELDRHYIQSRYPNGFPGGYPAQFYTKETAELCVHYASQIIEIIRKRIG